MGLLGWALLALCAGAAVSLLTWSAADPSLTRTTSGVARNALGPAGANFSDLAMRLFGLAAVLMVLPPVFWGLQLITRRQLQDARLQIMLAPAAVLLMASAASALPSMGAWPLPYGLGGFLGDQTLRFVGRLLGAATPMHATLAAGLICLGAGAMLLTASLGMSVRDVWLLCQVGRPRLDVLARARRWFARSGERSEPASYIRREPVFDPSPEPRPERRQPMFSLEQAFEIDPAAPPSGKSVHLRRPIVRDPEFDRATDAASQEMARRFAPPPAREEPSGPAGLGLFRRRGPQPERAGDPRVPAAGERPSVRRGPVWPGSVPVPAEDDMPSTIAGPVIADPVPPPAEPNARSARDELYGRAVALVRAHRRASTADLQRSLGIRYLRAADLIDRMEREGIVGASVHGNRPILGMPSRPRIV
jgi:DNA segregation ATPase FtsK/SpoIIIE-like protein